MQGGHEIMNQPLTTWGRLGKLWQSIEQGVTVKAKQSVLIVIMVIAAWGMYSCGDKTEAQSHCYNQTVPVTLPISDEDLKHFIAAGLYHSKEYALNDDGTKALVEPEMIDLPAKKYIEVSVDEFENGKVYSFEVISIKTEDSKFKIMFTPVIEFEVCK